MRLATGTHVRCEYAPGMAMEAVADATGLNTPFGWMTYVDPPPPGAYLRENVTPEFAILFNPDGTYSASVGGQVYAGTWHEVH